MCDTSPFPFHFSSVVIIIIVCAVSPNIKTISDLSFFFSRLSTFFLYKCFKKSHKNLYRNQFSSYTSTIPFLIFFYVCIHFIRGWWWWWQGEKGNIMKNYLIKYRFADRSTSTNAARRKRIRTWEGKRGRLLFNWNFVIIWMISYKFNIFFYLYTHSFCVCSLFSWAHSLRVRKEISVWILN